MKAGGCVAWFVMAIVAHGERVPAACKWGSRVRIAKLPVEGLSDEHVPS